MKDEHEGCDEEIEDLRQQVERMRRHLEDILDIATGDYPIPLAQIASLAREGLGNEKPPESAGGLGEEMR